MKRQSNHLSPQGRPSLSAKSIFLYKFSKYSYIKSLNKTMQVYSQHVHVTFDYIITVKPAS